MPAKPCDCKTKTTLYVKATQRGIQLVYNGEIFLFTWRETWEGCGLISNHPPPKTYMHPLSAWHSSHQIKFLLCSALVLYLQNVLLEQHKHVTMRTLERLSHRVKAVSWLNHLHFLPWPLRPEAYQNSFLSLCLFFTIVGFSWKTVHYACVSLDHGLAAKAKIKVVWNWVSLIKWYVRSPIGLCQDGRNSGKRDGADRKPGQWLGHLWVSRWLQNPQNPLSTH